MPWNPNPGPGWGYQGVCWGCGEVGHKQIECPYALGWVELGRVWDMCQVTRGKPVALSNRWDAFREEEDEDDDDDELVRSEGSRGVT